MITVSGFIQQLKSLYPSVKFFNGSIDKNSKQCVGIYARGNAQPIRAIGSTSSYNTLPISILVHWTENSDDCEKTANDLYEKLYNSDIADISGKRIVLLQLLESHPVDVGRDANNICERVIRLNIIYER